MNTAIKEKIKTITGSKNFFDSEEDRLCYSFDATPLLKQLPEAVVFPENEEQISKILKLANQESLTLCPEERAQA